MTASSKPSAEAGLGLIGAGSAACAACCAGPVVGFLAASGIASVVGAGVFGVIGLLVVLTAAAVIWRRRRRQPPTCKPVTETAPIDAPRLRTRQ
jgi:hypothetical protein